jgi:3'-5' exoribonuclease
MSKQFIKDLKDGDVIQSEFRALNVTSAVAKNGNPFKKCTLSDKSGSLAAIGFMSEEASATLQSGQITYIYGKVEAYNGKLQIKISETLPRTTGSEADSDFDSCTKYDVQKMWETLVDYIGTIESATIRRVAEDLFLGQGYQEQFRVSPAATGMHHAFKGGLLEHTTQMLDCADTLLKLPFFEPLNRDICMFGIMFHDFGKIFEYSSEQGFKKTVQGMLVPHIPMMGALIFETCNKFGVPEIIRDHLMHVVLAHHMQIAWGSPVIPAFPEAAFVHYVDNLHGTVFGWLQKIEDNAASGAEVLEKWDNGKSPLLATSFTTILKTVEANDAATGEFNTDDLPF